VLAISRVNTTSIKCLSDLAKRSNFQTTKVSPMAWIHITFTGRYHFNDKEVSVDLHKIILILEKQLKKLGII